MGVWVVVRGTGKGEVSVSVSLFVWGVDMDCLEGRELRIFLWLG